MPAMPHPRPAPDTRKPYSGHTRSLVIAIDVGTTFSGVSYAILEPGEIPKIHGVTRFPGQEHVAGNTKIPSVIYYDKHGKMMAAGAEADTSTIQAQAEDEGWIKAELFKLRLRPRTMQLNMNGMRLGPLPKRKTAVHVFGDFLAYLYRCTRNFITDTHANGGSLWNQVESDIQFVLSHPNGWEGAQQSKMRRAAIYGGLIPDANEGKARIRFVTEGEASLHACVLNGLAADVLSSPSKHGFLIADAGGGTLDISAYAIRGASPLVIEEIAPPDCIFAGSVFVSRRAREFLEEKLKKSRYGTPDALDHITRRFDETTKRLFRDRRDLQFIPFGSPLDKDPLVGIRGGQLKLTGQEVADLFEPSVDAAFKSIRAQIEASQGMIKSVFLVGGYAASPWLFGQLQERLAPYKVVVSRPDTQTSKAVADGAIGFYCDHHVSARMSKYMYGVEFLREMDPRDPEHVARKEKLCELPSGPKLLPDAFDCILARNIKVKESMVFTRKYCTELTSLSMLSVFEVEIWCYRGGNTIPLWINRQAENFSTLCVVRADLSPLAGSAEPKSGKHGKSYWTIVFSVEIQFGLTEFKARIKWVDNGVTKYGPASIIYNERGHRADEDEPDVFPEDDLNTASASTTPRSATRSEPVSRSRTPMVDHFSQQPYSASAASSRRPSQSTSRGEAGVSMYSNGSNGIPDAARVEKERTSSKGQYSPPRGSGTEREKNGWYGHESDMKRGTETPVSSKGKERERESSKATPKNGSRIGEALSSVWGSGSQSKAASPKHTSPTTVEQPQVSQPQTPGHYHSRTTSQVQKSPWVETISATIETPKTHSPWDAIPSAVPKSVPIGSGHSGGEREREREKGRVGEERMAPLWDDAPRSSYGEPPKTPWGGSRVPSIHPGADESTVLLAAEELPAGVSRSVSAGSKSPWGASASKDMGSVPLDADDAPTFGKQSGWGPTASTPKSVTANVSPSAAVAAAGEAWDPSGPASAVTPSVTGSKTPKGAAGRSRKNSIGAGVLSKGSPASGSKSPFGAFGAAAAYEEPATAGKSPNLLAGATAFGVSSSKRSSPLNPTVQEPFSAFGTAPADAQIPIDGGGNTFDSWGTTGGNDNWDLASGGDNNNNVTDSWGFGTATTEHHAQYDPASTGTGNNPFEFGAVTSAFEPAVAAAVVDSPKTPGGKTSKSSGLKTPKTPAAEASSPFKTPVAADGVSGFVDPLATVQEGVTEEPGMTVTGSKKKKKKGGLAATLAAEEEERKKKEQEQEERKQREAEEQARIAAEAERLETERLDKEIAELEAKTKAEEERAKAADDGFAFSGNKKGKKSKKEEKEAKEREEREAKERAEKEAKEREEREAQEREKAAAAADDGFAPSGKKAKKIKKGTAINLWDDEEKEAKECEEREAKELAEKEAKEKEEREAQERENAAAAAAAAAADDGFAAAGGKKGKKIKKGTAIDLWEDVGKEAKEREEREAKERTEKEAKEKEEREAQEREEAAAAAAADDGFAPSGKKGKKNKKGTTLNLWEDEEKQTKEREEKEKAEKEAKQREEQAKAEQEAKEKEQQAAETGGSSSVFGFGSGGWGSSTGTGKSGLGLGGLGLGGWGGNPTKPSTPSIKSALGGWGMGGSFGASFGSAFGIGDSGNHTEEIKLDAVDETTKPKTPSPGEPLILSSVLDAPAENADITKSPSKHASKANTPALPASTNLPTEDAPAAETPAAETPLEEAPAPDAEDWGGTSIKPGKKKKGKGNTPAEEPPAETPKEEEKGTGGGGGGGGSAAKKKKKKGGK